MKHIKKRKLWEKALPYIYIWNSILSDMSDFEYHSKIGIILPAKMTTNFDDIFEYLRHTYINFILVTGMNKDGSEINGLLCMDENRQLSNIEDCFFIGDIKTAHDESINVVLTAKQLIDFIGEDSNFIIGDVLFSKKQKINNMITSSFCSLVLKTMQDLGEKNEG